LSCHGVLELMSRKVDVRTDLSWRASAIEQVQA
jgi:hypothetical protein